MEKRLNPKKSHTLINFYRNQSDYQLSDIVSHVEEFARDRRGSKFLQQKLRDSAENRKEKVFQEIRPILCSLMIDRYANFVIQRFYEVGTKKQCEIIFNCILNSFANLCFDIYGCRVVQFIMDKDKLPDNGAELIKTKLSKNVREFARHQYAHYVLMKCFTSDIFPNKDELNFILVAYIGRIAKDCMHQYSCQIFQRIIKAGTDTQRCFVMKEISSQTILLAKSRYGNYVLQEVINTKSTMYTFGIIQELYSFIWNLAQNKYASNVIEKLLDLQIAEKSNLIQAAYIQLMAMHDKDLVYMFIQRFSNYIMQKFVRMLNPTQTLNLSNRLEPFETVLMNHSGSRKALNELKNSLMTLLYNNVLITNTI